MPLSKTPPHATAVGIFSRTFHVSSGSGSCPEFRRQPEALRRNVGDDQNRGSADFLDPVNVIEVPVGLGLDPAFVLRGSISSLSPNWSSLQLGQTVAQAVARPFLQPGAHIVHLRTYGSALIPFITRNTKRTGLHAVSATDALVLW